jgi:hypothetical protein
MRRDLANARIGHAEHAYPTPNRGHKSQASQDMYWDNPVNAGTRTLATPVRYGRLQADGTIRYVSKIAKPITDAENRAADIAASNARIAAMVAGTTAQVDTWAAKS